ncbi:hypothetical protein [Soehngenia longivitae]|jgi:hypothetical protein|nr:hypothetical protein [Soehngenia longivitae]
MKKEKLESIEKENNNKKVSKLESTEIEMKKEVKTFNTKNK